MQTDLKVVAKLAKKREKENWRFRSFLKGLDIEIEELDALVHELYKEVAGQIDCCACGNCCCEILPLLHPSDVARLAQGLGLPEKEVTARYLVPDEEEDALTFNKSPCPLLSEKRCTVYDSRPDDCRSYPHLLEEEFVFRLFQAVDNCSICPIVFNVMELLKGKLWHRPFADDW